MSLNQAMYYRTFFLRMQIKLTIIKPTQNVTKREHICVIIETSTSLVIDTSLVSCNSIPAVIQLWYYRMEECVCACVTTETPVDRRGVGVLIFKIEWQNSLWITTSLVFCFLALYNYNLLTAYRATYNPFENSTLSITTRNPVCVHKNDPTCRYQHFHIFSPQIN